MAETQNSVEAQREGTLVFVVIRGVVGGVLMGLANLVPGISGGTMLVAAGVYQRFINAIAEISTFKFRARSVLIFGAIVISALLSIALLAGTVKSLVVHHRWIMYSLFIGLTLGGVPVVWKMVKRATPGLWTGAVVGFILMGFIAWAQAQGWGESKAEDPSFVLLLMAGLAGASAMILPGVSGGYLLLVLGVYVLILDAIESVTHQLRILAESHDFSAAWQGISHPLFHVVVPVGIGVVVGIVAVSNVLRFLLRRFELPTLGVLLGLLVGAVVGLWPFQKGVAPAIGTMFHQREVTQELLESLSPDKYPTVFFTPTFGQVMVAFGCIVGGFAATALIARLSREKS